jgi:hypothetical protein
MKRREFIAGLGGAAWPLAARAGTGYGPALFGRCVLWAVSFYGSKGR